MNTKIQKNHLIKKMNAIKFLIFVLSLAIFYPPILKQYQYCETLRLKDEENKVTKIVYENKDVYVFHLDSLVWESPKLTDYREMFQRM